MANHDIYRRAFLIYLWRLKITLRKFRAITNMKSVYISDKITHNQPKNLSEMSVEFVKLAEECLTRRITMRILSTDYTKDTVNAISNGNSS